MASNIFSPKPEHPEGPWDIAIIGSGPSGLTAAIYTTRGAASTIIFGGESWGGQLMLTTTVDNFPALPGTLGPDLMQKMRDHAVSFGAEFIQKNVDSVNAKNSPFELTSDSKTYTTRSIIIATGAETKWLDAPGVKELIGRGVSSCAPCDAPFFRNKKVAVVGGGDAAMEEALVLSKYCTSVTLIHRRNEFKASKIMQDRVLAEPKINILWDTEVVEVKGTERLEKVLIKNNKSGEISDLLVDGLFVAIGHKPGSELFKDIVTTDEKGFIQLSERSKSNVPGIFVAGDVHDHHYKQAITAAGFGCMAGMDVLEYLEELKHS